MRRAPALRRDGVVGFQDVQDPDLAAAAWGLLGHFCQQFHPHLPIMHLRTLASASSAAAAWGLLGQFCQHIHSARSGDAVALHKDFTLVGVIDKYSMSERLDIDSGTNGTGTGGEDGALVQGVVVPANTLPGQQFEVIGLDGTPIVVTVPAGMGAGDTFLVSSSAQESAVRYAFAVFSFCAVISGVCGGATAVVIHRSRHLCC